MFFKKLITDTLKTSTIISRFKGSKVLSDIEAEALAYSALHKGLSCARQPYKSKNSALVFVTQASTREEAVENTSKKDSTLSKKTEC